MDRAHARRDFPPQKCGTRPPRQQRQLHFGQGRKPQPGPVRSAQSCDSEKGTIAQAREGMRARALSTRSYDSMRILTAGVPGAIDFLPFSAVAAADRAKAPEIGALQNADATPKNLFVAKRRGVRWP